MATWPCGHGWLSRAFCRRERIGDTQRQLRARKRAYPVVGAACLRLERGSETVDDDVADAGPAAYGTRRLLIPKHTAASAAR